MYGKIWESGLTEIISVLAIWALVEKEFPDTKHFRLERIYWEQRGEVERGAANTDFLADQGEPPGDCQNSGWLKGLRTVYKLNEKKIPVERGMLGH